MSTSLLELISDPIRLSVLRTLADRGSASLAEIAELAGVHPNTARPHLADLERAGAVERVEARRPGRGRPRVAYRLAEGWTLPAAESGALAELLAALVRRLDPSPAQVDDLGRQWGRFLTGRPGARRDPGSVVGIFERLGFDVELRGGDLRLRGCPCPLVSPEAPELVCRLTQAVADGAVRSLDARRAIVSARHDPERRSCALEVGTAPG
jgi:predicted ArsR family transcriptional regulator